MSLVDQKGAFAVRTARDWGNDPLSKSRPGRKSHPETCSRNVLSGQVQCCRQCSTPVCCGARCPLKNWGLSWRVFSRVASAMPLDGLRWPLPGQIGFSTARFRVAPNLGACFFGDHLHGLYTVACFGLFEGPARAAVRAAVRATVQGKSQRGRSRRDCSQGPSNGSSKPRTEGHGHLQGRMRGHLRGPFQGPLKSPP